MLPFYVERLALAEGVDDDLPTLLGPASGRAAVRGTVTGVDP